MSRCYNPAKFHRHWVYNRKEICEILGISDNTISNMIGRGLEPIDDKRPQIFSGHVLRQFLTKLRWPYGRQPENGRLYCPSCSSFRPLLSATIKSLPTGIACYAVTGACTDCHDMLQVTVSYTVLPQILAAPHNTIEDPSDVMDGGISGGIGRSGASIPPETHKSNLRWLYSYRIYLEHSRERKDDTIDEHLRALNRMSDFFGHKPFEKVTLQDVIGFKNELRRLRDQGGKQGLSRSTVVHTLDRCGSLFKWLHEEQDVPIERGLAGYFNSSRKERASAAAMVKEISLTFDQALCLFKAMPTTSPIELRNRAVVAMFVVTGIRISALISLRGKHVNMHTRWISQDPQEVDTKQDKYIRTYCLDLGHGLLDAITEWAKWRAVNGFHDQAAFFLPDRYIQPNGIGLGFRPDKRESAECWKSEDSAQRIIKDAGLAVGIPDEEVSSHDFRKIIFGHLAKNGMLTLEEIALQLNFGQTPTELIRRHYFPMMDTKREKLLDELCRRAGSYRSELELYLGYERKLIGETDPDFRRAKDIFERNSDPKHGA
jgi:site-specific recombinase XerC